MLVAFRFLNGFSVTGLTLGPSIVGDLILKENRGRAMSLAISLPVIAPFTAPAIGSYTAERLGWRWTIWLMAITVGVSTAAALICFRETYKVKILQKKVVRLRKSTGNTLLHSKYQEHESQPVLQSMFRPIKVLFQSSTVFLVTVYMGMNYGIGYVIITTLVPMVEERYHFSEGAAGLAFLGRGKASLQIHMLGLLCLPSP
jgi:MFS family permease